MSPSSSAIQPLVQTRLPVDKFRQLQRLARGRYLTMSAFVRQLLLDHLATTAPARRRKTP